MKVIGLLVALLLWPLWASAHPLGNNTVNRQAAIVLGGRDVRIDYRVDLAEIPTLLAAQSADGDADGKLTADEWQRYAQSWARALIPDLDLRLAERVSELEIISVDWQLADGAAGLSQLRLHAVLRTPAPAPGRAPLHYTDSSRPEEAGWREVWVRAAAGARVIATTAAREDRSQGLTHFPPLGTGLLNEISAHVDADFDGSGSAVTPQAANIEPASASVRPHSLPALFLLGAHHIASGWDHLVFLLGLVLLTRSLRDLLVVVSAFTVAHSLTLGVAAAGLVTPPGSLVEAAIALSIAYVGMCNVYQRQRAHGLALAFGFGLIHGFGFAGALAETLGPHALDGHGWLLGLAAFNLGIECFQIALLLVVVPLLRYGARLRWAPLARRGAAHGVLWAGLSWFALRVGGL